MSTATLASSVVPDYGIDAPGVRRVFFMLAAAGAGALAGATVLLPAGSTLQTVFCAVGSIAVVYGAGMGSYMTWGSRVGKLRTRERILDRVATLLPSESWSGRETVLDVGCGRGLMLIGAAHRLTTGTVIGVDLWREADQLGNSPDATRENARGEGVLDRICVETANALALPLGDRSVDVVVSHWVVHNLDTPEERARALDEMWRVLRPGGVLALADIAGVPDYAEHLAGLGASDVAVDYGGWEARIMGTLSGGSYRPQSLVARRRP